MGIIFDRIAAIVFRPWKKSFRRRAEQRMPKGEKLGRVWERWCTAGAKDWLDFTYNRIRIIRATALNALLIMIVANTFIALHVMQHKAALIAIVTVLGALVSIASILGWARLTESYYHVPKFEKLKK